MAEKIESIELKMLDALEAVIDFADNCYRDVWKNGDHDTYHYCPLCSNRIGHEEECPMPQIKLITKEAKNFYIQK
jgi:hypothetical protein